MTRFVAHLPKVWSLWCCACMLGVACGQAFAYTQGNSECIWERGKAKIEACRRALKESPSERYLYLELAEGLEKERRFGEAVDAYNAALGRFPDDQEIIKRLEIAESYTRENQWITQREEGEGSTLSSGRVGQVPLKQKLLEINCMRRTGKVALQACDDALRGKPDSRELLERRSFLFAELKPSEPSEPETTATVAAANAPGAAASAPRDAADVIEKLQLLDALKGRGLLSAEEYENRRIALLDSEFGARRQTGPDDGSGEARPEGRKVSAQIDFGVYHALVIGMNDYTNFPKLETAVGDATTIGAALREDYGFDVTVLTNASRYQILKTLGGYRDRLTDRDNLLIYYGGHGYLDKRVDRGYWLPVDAERGFNVNWISAADITDVLKAIEARHILIVADSCYSGTLTRSAGPLARPSRRLDVSLVERLRSKRSRTVLTSGGLEPVVDGGGEGHSIFARAFLDALAENDDVMEGTRLFAEIRKRVVLNADQTPEYADVRKAGHDGGDFLFVRR